MTQHLKYVFFGTSFSRVSLVISASLSFHHLLKILLFYYIISFRPTTLLVAGVDINNSYLFSTTLPYSSQVLKVLVASVAVLLIIPLLLGILFEFVVVIPLRVPLDQTALLYIWQVRKIYFLIR